MKKLLIVILTFIIVTAINCQLTQAENVCSVADPTGTPLNVRSAPQGKVIGKLSNGLDVDIIEVKYDKKGKPWALVSGLYKGEFQKIGWVYQNYLNCNPIEDEELILDEVCKVADPTGTPLNVRSTLAGKVVGKLNNGDEVYTIDVRKDKKGNEWTKVAVYKNNKYNVVGWVFTKYLNCGY